MKIRIQKSLDIGIRTRHSINRPKDDRNTGKNWCLKQLGKGIRLGKKLIGVKDNKNLMTAEVFEHSNLAKVLSLYIWPLLIISDVKHCHHPTPCKAWERKHYVGSHVRIAGHRTHNHGGTCTLCSSLVPPQGHLWARSCCHWNFQVQDFDFKYLRPASVSCPWLSVCFQTPINEIITFH